MSLNIKNERVHALAREAAELTGTTQTGAIEQALERLIAEHRAGQASRRDRALEWYAQHQATITDAHRQDVRDAQDEMYDEHGVPR